MNRMLTATHRDWHAPEADAGMPAAEEAALGLRVTDRALYRAGRGWVPVSGEIHYSRLPRERWAERLGMMRASGVDVASTYVFWNHHSAARGEASFSGRLDVGAFIDACAAAGMLVALRIGPWVHAESRNGGFPDWVQEAPVTHRSDDPAYLELVEAWFAQLATALDGRAQAGGPVIAVQLENELYDRPEHLETLKRLAREAGIAAPLWTATAWGGAQLPASGVMPLFGGYADGFWVEPADEWHPSFRAHFLPSHEWDDPGVGADVRSAQGFDAAAAEATTSTELHGFPPATCELGGGMATAYHRRPVLSGRDVAALAHGKIGNGSAWQGFYMFAGGDAPAPDLQETQDTGYPNDMPRLGYDFHAPIGQSGDPAPSLALLRQQHAFLEAFGPVLAAMPSTLPDRRPTGIDDTTTLRWSMRSDGHSGFVVISHHQPYRRLDDVRGARLRVASTHGDVDFGTVDVPAGTLARWPFGLQVGDSRLDLATASALTMLDERTLVLVADDGIEPRVRLDGEEHVLPASGGVVPGRGGARIVVLDAATAGQVFVVGGPSQRRMLHTACDVAVDAEVIHTRGHMPVREYDVATEQWRELRTAGAPGRHVAVTPFPETPGAPPATAYGFGGERHRAPTAGAFDRLAAVWRLPLPAWTLERRADAVLDLDLVGDVAELRWHGQLVDDRYLDGTRWSFALADLPPAPDGPPPPGGVVDGLTLHLVGLSSASTIGLAAPAAARLATAPDGVLRGIESAHVRERGPWHRVD